MHLGHGGRRRRQETKRKTVPAFGIAAGGGIATPVLYDTHYNFPERSIIKKGGQTKESRRGRGRVSAEFIGVSVVLFEIVGSPVQGCPCRYGTCHYVTL